MNWKNTKLDVSERRMWFAMEHPNWHVSPKSYDEAKKYIDDLKELWPKGTFEVSRVANSAGFAGSESEDEFVVVQTGL